MAEVRENLSVLIGDWREKGNSLADCRKTFVGASIARPCPFVLQENCPEKCAAVVGWRATNGRPYTRNKARMQFLDGLKDNNLGYFGLFCKIRIELCSGMRYNDKKAAGRYGLFFSR